MSSQQLFSAELVAKLTCTTEPDISSMIRNLPLPKTSPIRRHLTTISSLGNLDSLPPELLSLVLNILDLQSLSRLSRVSLKGKLSVKAVPAYREILQHAPQTLVALGKTRLLKHYSAVLLRQTLRSNKCVSCFDFGAFLFLPTCERVCFECLFQNHALRMTPLGIAKKCFHLTEKQLNQIPVLHSIPGVYGVMSRASCRQVVRLVSVKQAKQLAIEVHGSAENVAKLMPIPPPREMSTRERREFYTFKLFHEAPLEPPGCDLALLPTKANILADPFGGVASMRIPYLSDAGLDYGRLCRGCQVTERHGHRGALPPVVLRELVVSHICPNRPFHALVTRLHSEQGFLNHINNCYGVRHLLTEWEQTEQ